MEPHTWTAATPDSEQQSLHLIDLGRTDGFRPVAHNREDDLPVSSHADIPVALLNRFRSRFPHRGY